MSLKIEKTEKKIDGDIILSNAFLHSPIKMRIQKKEKERQKKEMGDKVRERY